MPDTAVAVTREVYEAFNRGDLARVEQLFDPDIEWIEPEGYFLPEGRSTNRGRETVMGFLRAFGTYWASFEVLPDRVFGVDESTVVAFGRQRGRAQDTGKELDVPFANLWEVSDGLVTSHWSVADTLSVARALDAQ